MDLMDYDTGHEITQLRKSFHRNSIISQKNI